MHGLIFTLHVTHVNVTHNHYESKSMGQYLAIQFSSSDALLFAAMYGVWDANTTGGHDLLQQYGTRH